MSVVIQIYQTLEDHEDSLWGVDLIDFPDVIFDCKITTYPHCSCKEMRLGLVVEVLVEGAAH